MEPRGEHFRLDKDEIIGKPVDVLFTRAGRGRAGGELSRLPPRAVASRPLAGAKDGTFLRGRIYGAAGEDGKPPSYVKIASDATQRSWRVL